MTGINGNNLLFCFFCFLPRVERETARNLPRSEVMEANDDLFIPAWNLKHIIKTMEGLSQTNKINKEKKGIMCLHKIGFAVGHNYTTQWGPLYWLMAA